MRMCSATALILVLLSSATEPAGSAQILSGPEERDAMLSAYFERLSAPRPIPTMSLEAWEKRRREIRRLVRSSLGLDPFPERVSLDVQYGGSLDREDYVLRRVYFQVWPDVYASAWLYLPRSPGKHPAVLNPHGHWALGAMDPTVQERCIGFAKKGYVSLTVDAVHLPLQSYLSGACSATPQIWSLMRGVDFLETLPEVDPERIGCTGESGGGLQTLYMMILDDRIKVAAPAVYVSYFRRILFPGEEGHCTCNWVPGLLRETDEPEMAAVFAPRPALYLSVTGDWTARFPDEEFKEIQNIYALYGEPDMTDAFQWQSEHAFSTPMREKVYGWFNKHLKSVEDSAEAREPQIKTESPETLRSLNVTLTHSRPVSQIVSLYEARSAGSERVPTRRKGWQKRISEIQTGLAEVLGDVHVQGTLAAEPELREIQGRPAEGLRIRSEEEITVPAMLIKPESLSRPALVIVLHPKGKQTCLVEGEELIRLLLSGGTAVLLPDVRLTGELRRQWDYNCLIWGRPEVGMAVTDTRACLDALEDRPDLDASRVAVVGLGESGVTALLVGAMDPRVLFVAADHLGPTYACGRSLPRITNIRCVADLPEMALAVGPRNLMVGGIAEGYELTRKGYERLGAGDRLTLQGETLSQNALAEAILRRLRIF